MLTAAPAARALPAQFFHHAFFDLDAQPHSCEVSIFRRLLEGVPRIAVILSAPGALRPADAQLAGLAPSLHRVATEIHFRHFPRLSPFYVRWFLHCAGHNLYFEADMEFEDRAEKHVYRDVVFTPISREEVEGLCGGAAEP